MTRFRWVLLVFTLLNVVLPSFTGFCWDLLGFTSYYLVLLGYTEFYWVFLRFNLFFFLGVTVIYWVLLFDFDASRCENERGRVFFWFFFCNANDDRGSRCR